MLIINIGKGHWQKQTKKYIIIHVKHKIYTSNLWKGVKLLYQKLKKMKI